VFQLFSDAVLTLPVSNIHTRFIILHNNQQCTGWNLQMAHILLTRSVIWFKLMNYKIT